MDATAVLKQDHDKVKQLFQRFQGAGSPDERSSILGQIMSELETHTRIEEQVFYPAVRKEGSQLEDTVREGLEEHHVVDELMTELKGMGPDDEQFGAKAKVLQENVEHHIEEEEGELFPGVHQALGEERLQQLGDELERAKGRG